MMDRMAAGQAGQLREIRLSRAAFKSLSTIPGMGCGTLSPLARIVAPSEPPQHDALVAAIQGMAGPWEWAMPALIDPFTTVSLVVGDGETTLLGQYVFPDVEARGPGFKVFLDGMDVVMQGPVTVQEVEQGVLDLLSLAGVGEAPTLRMTMSTEQFWALNAVVDAYREAALRRRLSRQGGLPIGVSVANVVAAWDAGLAAPNPGWSVSLFNMMVPGSELPGFGQKLPALLAQMEKDGLLSRIEGEPGEARNDLFYFLEDSLDSLCQTLYRASINLGLTVQRKRATGIDMSMIGVWRTGAGLALADIGEAGKGRVDLVVAGPSVLVESLETILGAQGEPQPFDQFSVPSPFKKDAILAGLSGTPIVFAAAARVTPKFCLKCGAELQPGIKFCPKCGTNLQS